MATTAPLLVKLLQTIDEAIEASEVERALRLVLNHFDALRDTGLMRERIAVILAQRGRKKEAVGVLDRIGRHYANAGYPTRAVSAIKQMQALQPDATMLLDHFATLYNIRSPFLQRERNEPIVMDVQLGADDIDLEVEGPPGDLDELLEEAIDRASDDEGLADEPGEVPPLPLLSKLPNEALRRVLDFVEFEIFAEPQPVIARGEITRDLIWTVSDDLTVEQDGELLRLPAGAFLGLAGIAGARRSSAITVMSQKGSEVLRLSHDSLESIFAEYEDFPNRLATLRRHALTEGLLRRHPIFAGLEEDEREALIERFTGLHVEAETHLIRQNHPSPGLYLMLDGEVDIIRSVDEIEVTIESLRAGEIFGEIGLSSQDGASTADVVTTESSHLLFLPGDHYEEAAERHPSLAHHVSGLARARREAIAHSLSSQDLQEIE